MSTEVPKNRFKDQTRSNAYARENLLDWERRRGQFLIDVPQFLSGVTPQKKAVVERLGDLRGRRVLEFGSGNGVYAAFLALAGAEVVGLDVGRDIVELARRVAVLNSSRCHFVVADAALAPFGDGTFDFVVGHGVLHHLSCSDLKRAVAEACRVLKPQGRAYFSEPVENSRFCDFLQNAVAINSRSSSQTRPSILQRRKWRAYLSTLDDRSLSDWELIEAKGAFDQVTLDYHGFLIRLARLCAQPAFARLLRRLDRVLTHPASPLRKMSQCVVACYSKGTRSPRVPPREPSFHQRTPQ